MNYSLSSSRKIGNYIQKIITTFNNTKKEQNANTLNFFFFFHTAFATLDASGREVCEIEYKGFTETQSTSISNLGSLADITLTVLSNSTSNPKTTTLKVNNVYLINLKTNLNTAFNALTGSDIDESTNYLISAIVNLH